MFVENNLSVDVVVPFYRETIELDRALESCRLPGNSLFIRNIFIVCDGDQEIFNWANDNVVPKDSRIKILKTNGRQGAGVARNLGLELCKSDLVAFLDADDSWLPYKLWYQIQALIKTPSSGCCASYVISGKTLVIPSKIYDVGLDVLKNLKIGTSTVLLYRDCIGTLRFTTREFSQDVEFWFNFVQSNGRLIGLNQVACIYYSSFRTSNKFLQLLHFNRFVFGFEFSIFMRLYIIMRYIIRGSINHFFLSIAARI